MIVCIAEAKDQLLIFRVILKLFPKLLLYYRCICSSVEVDFWSKAAARASVSADSWGVPCWQQTGESTRWDTTSSAENKVIISARCSWLLEGWNSTKGAPPAALSNHGGPNLLSEPERSPYQGFFSVSPFTFSYQTERNPSSRPWHWKEAALV